MIYRLEYRIPGNRLHALMTFKSWEERSIFIATLPPGSQIIATMEGS